MIAANLTKQPCPICKESIPSEHSLKKNVMLEEAVVAWKAARSKVLENARGTLASDRDKPERNLKRKRSLTPPSTPSTSRNSRSCDLAGTEPTDVACPICKKMVGFNNVGKHVDSKCTWMDTETKENKKQWANFFTGEGTSPSKSRAKGKQKMVERVSERAHKDLPPQPMPQLSYDLMKDKELKDALKKCGLSTEGNRDFWKARHKQWTALVNSNYDSSYPRLVSALRTELKVWEANIEKSRQQNKRDKKSTEDAMKYLKVHRADFKRLVQGVRDREVTKRREPTTMNEPISIPSSPSAVVPDDRDLD